MNYRKCVYFVEGPCEKQLIEVLNKQHPYLLTPGKVNVLNPIQALIPRRQNPKQYYFLPNEYDITIKIGH